MFLKFLLNQLKQLILDEYQFYKFQKNNPSCEIIRPFTIVNPHLLFMGKNVKIRRNTYFHCGGYDWSKGKGKIIIGDNCWFSENNILYGAGEIEIGKMTGIGPNSMIFSSRDNYSREFAFLPHIVHHFGKVSLGNYVRVFSNVVITPGVTIGDGAVIGAGSVVTKDIPPWTVAIGAPAKVIKLRDKDEFRPHM
jgi:acetyltransferase-like isoleucine patch superfamily enzyme